MSRPDLRIDGNIAYQGATQVNNINYSFGREEFLAQLPFADEALFNSYAKREHSTCLDDTRVDILSTIYTWANEDREPWILWLDGLAGTGKSTIARTVCRKFTHLDEQHGIRLGASFFFDRGIEKVGHAGTFVTTIVRQLMNRVAGMEAHVLEAIKADNTIVNQLLEDQWERLVLRPLSKITSGSGDGHYLLVIDALDECNNTMDAVVILQMLNQICALGGIRLRVLLTSRSDSFIRSNVATILEGRHRNIVLHKETSSSVDNDISVFYKYQFKVIRTIFCMEEVGWPGWEALSDLVQSASGLFIWAATACRFVADGDSYGAEDRLSIVLRRTIESISTTDEDSSVESNPDHRPRRLAPEDKLNELYLTILHHATRNLREERKRWYKSFRLIMGTIVTSYSPLSPDALAGLLQIGRDVVVSTLNNLHAILDIREDRSEPIRLHHPSFRDFMLDSRRCENRRLTIDAEQAHQHLASSCLKLLDRALKRDICSVKSPGTLRSDVSSGDVSAHIGPDVQYACLFWTQHYKNGDHHFKDGDQVHEFLRKHYLHWLEALAWIGNTSEAVHAILLLENMVSADDCPKLHDLVQDMKRFIQAHRPAIQEAPLQVYLCTVLFTPKMSPVRQLFEIQLMPWLGKWIRRLPNGGKIWNEHQLTYECHREAIRAIQFSPDGQTVVTASNDKTIELRETETGIVKQVLEGHRGYVSAIAFSPDGGMLVSASNDSTIRVWDLASSTVKQILRADTNHIMALTFLAKPSMLAVVSGHKKVKLWDMNEGAMFSSLDGHQGSVVCLAYSPSKNILATGATDAIVKLWDAKSFEELHSLVGHTSTVRSVAFSRDGVYLASGSDDTFIRIWATNESNNSRNILRGHQDRVTAVAFSFDGELLASASTDKTVRIWDAKTGTQLRTLRRYFSSSNGLTFSPVSRQLLVIQEQSVELWNVVSDAVQDEMEGHSRYVSAISFSVDGTMVASGSADETIKLWHTGDDQNLGFGTLLRTIEGDMKHIRDLAFSPCGNLLFSASVAESFVRVWDVASGTMLRTLDGLPEPIRLVACSSDGNHVAATWDKNAVMIWDIESTEALYTLKSRLNVYSLAFSQDGSSILTNVETLPLPNFDNKAMPTRPQVRQSVSYLYPWIYRGNERVFWLTKKHRDSRKGIYGSKLILTSAAGDMYFIELAGETLT